MGSMEVGKSVCGYDVVGSIDGYSVAEVLGMVVVAFARVCLRRKTKIIDKRRP